MLSAILKGIFGTKSDRDVRRMRPLIERINAFEAEYQRLGEAELKGKTDEFRARLANGETTDDLLCEAFATVKNACRRLVGTPITVCGNETTWDMVPFDVQLIGGIVLHRSNIAEMATGEGKTLVATLPLYLNALTGRNCQLVTVNDYLARRDAEWMGTVYRYLGLTVGCIQNQMSSSQRREQYGCDITYGTNSEFGFDYLRDMGMASSREQLVQRDHFYAIVDEVDSILVDEARTPLIISGPVAVSTHQFDKLKGPVAEIFRKQSFLCSRLIQEAKVVLDRAGVIGDGDGDGGAPDKDADPKASGEELDDAVIKLLQVRFGMPTHRQLMHLLEDGAILKRVEKAETFVRSDQNRGMLQEVQEDLFFVIDERGHEADLTEKGRLAISPDDPETFTIPDLLETLHQIDTDPALDETGKIKRRQEFQEQFSQRSEMLHNLSQLLRAYTLYEKDVHYVVQENKVLIVDEHTGRLMPGRRFSEGLHQALEAKEGVHIERETQTLATITIQNYFRMYKKLAGMTGTAETEASEFHQIYKLDVCVIPTNRPCRRTDNNDCIYRTKREKYRAILEEVAECHGRGQPVLLGTVSVEVSEVISRMLKQRNIPHNVLNAKNHEREAEIVARAGQLGAVTVATNMAGRGTDIKLGPGVVELGGLHVLGSERHDSRRIDRQLRGRCARQGDPGSSRFYISLEDNLMRLFGSDRISTIMTKLGLEEGEELQHPWLNRSIETAQKRVEQHHFSTRKRTLEYDDVMNRQREVVYGLRRDVLMNDNPREVLFGIVRDEIANRVEAAFAAVGRDGEGADLDGLAGWLATTFPIGFTRKDLQSAAPGETPLADRLVDHLFARVEKAYQAKAALEEPESLIWLERHIILEAVDRLWQDHLYAMDHLRSTIRLRAYAQKDPLIEYKQEAFTIFNDLMTEIYQEVLTNLFRSATSLAAFESLFASLPRQTIHDQIGQFGSADDPSVAEAAQQASPSAGTGSGPAPEGGGVKITFVRETAKVGRNDPCPCGSGKKFKKCCGA
jgi:preprotein translocase subunit SecA